MKEVFSYYLNFLKNHIPAQIFILLGFGLGVIITIVPIPLIYKEIIDTVSSGNGNTYEKLGYLITVLGLCILSYNILFRVGEYAMIKSQSKILKELYDHSLEKLQQHSYDFFSNAFAGGIVAKTKRFVSSFETLQDNFVFHIYLSAIALLSSFVVLWKEFSLLGVAFLVWLVFYGILVRFLVKWQIPKNIIKAKADTKTTAQYSDIISNILTVKMFGNEIKEKNKFFQTTGDEEKKRTAAWMQQSFYNSALQSAVIGIFNIIIIWFVIDLWKKGIVPTGTIVLVQVYVLTSFNIVWSISKSVVKTSAALTDAMEMINILKMPVGVEEISRPRQFKIAEGKIEICDVSFAYEDGNAVFKNLNLKINPGEKIALVGHSGSGKTTIIKILMRFVDVNYGQIFIDGEDITKVSQSDLRKRIAYVPQDPSLFHRTIAENIGYGKENISLEEIIQAAKKAEAHNFIMKLPKKYNSLVGERGIKLSGGERQRIAIARAIIKDAPIVILDEATSSLDSLVEERVQKALAKLISNKTTIVIAHRLSTIKMMNKIIVFDNGKIVEVGTHASLVKKRGFYYSLWKTQFEGFSE